MAAIAIAAHGGFVQPRTVQATVATLRVASLTKQLAPMRINSFGFRVAGGTTQTTSRPRGNEGKHAK